MKMPFCSSFNESAKRSSCPNRYPYYPHFGQTLTSAKVFSPRTAPSTGGTSQWSSDSDSGLDAGWDVEQHCINQWVNRGDLGELFRPFVA
jgi:hypothetical protein